MANERKCKICKKEYEYCPHCAQYEYLPKWMINYCSDNCHDVALIVNKYAFGHINAQEAASQLEAHDLSAIDNYPEEMRNIITVINADSSKSDDDGTAEKKTRKRTKKIVNED